MLHLKIHGMIVRDAPDRLSLAVAICAANRPDLKPQGIELEKAAQWNRGTAHACTGRNLSDERVAHLGIELVPERSKDVVGVGQNVLSKTQIERQPAAKFGVVIGFDHPGFSARAQLTLDAERDRVLVPGSHHVRWRH